MEDVKKMMKVADLTGDLLDQWVARAQNWTKFYDAENNVWWWKQKFINDLEDVLHCPCETYHPSEDWATGGPLLEEDSIFVVTDTIGMGDFPISYIAAQGMGILMLSPNDGRRPLEGEMIGSTYLEAGMRSFVSQRLGWEVEENPDWEQEVKLPGEDGFVGTPPWEDAPK